MYSQELKKKEKNEYMWSKKKYLASTYEPLLSRLNVQGVGFPSGLDDVRKLEKQNPELIFRIYEQYQNGYMMSYKTEREPSKTSKFVDLVLVNFLDQDYELDSHFYFVEKLRCFFSKVYKSEGERTSYQNILICERCLESFSIESAVMYQEHVLRCDRNEVTNFKISEEMIKFRNEKNAVTSVLTGYYDFETKKTKINPMCFTCNQLFKSTKVCMY